MRNWDACKEYKKTHNARNSGDYKECPLFAHYTGKCFQHCDLTSECTCGECVHWQGHCTTEKPIGQPKYNSNGRHKTYGTCPFVIGGLNSYFKHNCPHFIKRPDNFDWAMTDWVENELEKAGYDLAAPETRPARVNMRQKWFKMWKCNPPIF